MVDLPALIDCSVFVDDEIYAIIEKWIGFIDQSKDKTLRPMMLRLLFLSYGAKFPRESMDAMRLFVESLDANKAEVKLVLAWIRRKV